MDTKTAIKTALDTASMVVNSYLSDLTDEEMMHRPDPGCNHIKWQLGHLIASENRMMNGCFPDSMPELPEGFSDRYSQETSASNDEHSFDTKEQLVSIAQTQREGTLRLLESVTDEDLDREGPEAVREFAPTVGACFLMQDAHWMMHAGQWAVIRRQLGRGPLF